MFQIFTAIILLLRLLILIIGIALLCKYYIQQRIRYLYGAYDKDNYNGVYSEWGAYPYKQGH